MLGTFWQAIVAKRAVQAQVMLGIEQHSINVDFSSGMVLIVGGLRRHARRLTKPQCAGPFQAK